MQRRYTCAIVSICLILCVAPLTATAGDRAEAPTAEKQVVECQGAGWPADYVPTDTTIEVPTERLTWARAAIFPESHLPPLDVDTLAVENAERASAGAPLQVGITRDLNVDEAHGQWVGRDEGSAVWTAALVSEGAEGMRLRFTDLHLPPGGELYIYAPSAPEITLGPLTADGPHHNGAYWTTTLPGDIAYLEYLSPNGPAKDLPFRVAQVAHIYRPLDGASGGLRADLSCMLDVACYSQWEDISYSVAKITFQDDDDGQWYLCTGQLLAAQNDDLTPYFLTSGHCVDSQTEAMSTDFRWFFQRAICDTAGNMISQYSYDADFVATASNFNYGDWTLMLVKGTLPAGVFWSGWTTASITTGSDAVGVSHPQGYRKRYSLGTRSYGGTWWQKITFDQGVGTIDQGSSGSGVWTDGATPANQLLYGNCSFGYGYTNCDYPDEPVYYGKFSQYYSSISSALAGGSDDGHEPNDSCGGAPALSAGSYTGRIVKSVDEDWYRITLPACERLDVDLTFTSSWGNIDVQLYDACGGSVVASGTTSTNDEALSYDNTTGASGEYYLRVYLANDTRNTYDLSLTRTPIDAEKGDYNCDSSVDSVDYTEMVDCISGPDGGLGAGCSVFDWEDDSDVDLVDFAAMQTAYEG
ncbi:MAG: hypothetical protein GY842_01985 [bacterium]|nr:hypothetical protein [bacterium]